MSRVDEYNKEKARESDERVRGELNWWLFVLFIVLTAFVIGWGWEDLVVWLGSA